MFKEFPEEVREKAERYTSLGVHELDVQHLTGQITKAEARERARPIVAQMLQEGTGFKSSKGL